MQVTLGTFCCFFCCMPCNTRLINKLSFRPPDPTYDLIEENGQIKLNFRPRTWIYSDSNQKKIEVYCTKTRRQNTIVCAYIRCSTSPYYTILFSHGNAVDIGDMSNLYFYLGTILNCNVCAYDYSGYGQSQGKPTEKNLYADIEAVFDSLRLRYEILPDEIILYGQSIGTVPTIELASKCTVAGVILHSSLMSGIRVLFPHKRKTCCLDFFRNIDKVHRITSPTLIIHGTNDQTIDFFHGLSLYNKCPTAVDPLWVEGAGHNDIERFPEYLDRIRKFILIDINRNTNNSRSSTVQ